MQIHGRAWTIVKSIWASWIFVGGGRVRELWIYPGNVQEKEGEKTAILSYTQNWIASHLTEIWQSLSIPLSRKPTLKAMI